MAQEIPGRIVRPDLEHTDPERITRFDLSAGRVIDQRIPDLENSSGIGRRPPPNRHWQPFLVECRVDEQPRPIIHEYWTPHRVILRVQGPECLL
jgi:hypothetical protein